MASIDFYGVWLNSLSDLSDALQLLKGTKWRSPESKPGEIRDYSGRLRLIRRPGERKSSAVNVTFARADVRDWLVAHKGEPILYRDGAGLMFAGVYFSVDSTRRERERFDIAFTVDSITHTIEV
jgi:hypothetical protein